MLNDEVPNTSPSLELTILMPCLNEAETLEAVVRKASSFLQSHAVDGEVLIADNGSTDGSQDLARSLGARVIDVPERGYGAALLAGIAAARGRFTIMGDADDSYDFTALSPFLEKLRDGYELVMGNRFAGGIAPGAMPPLHRFLGNPVLSSAGRVLFHAPIRDFHCGLRGFDTQRMREIGLRTPGMEFASEMVVKSTLAGLRMTEVPTTLSPDGRSRPPHLRSWSDGWRHLRFLLLYSPRWLFLYPGLILMPVGALVMVTLATGPLRIGAVTLDINTIMFAAVAIVVGFDAVTFARAVEVIASRRAEPSRPRVFEALDRVLTLEKSLIIGVILLLLGVSAAFYAFNMWSLAGYGPLSPTASIRITIVSGTAIILGLQVILSSFFLGILRDEPGLP